MVVVVVATIVLILILFLPLPSPPPPTRQDPLRKEARLIWITSHPMPPQYKSQYRNEYTASAGDGYLLPLLLPLGVEVLPLLPLIRPRMNETTDDHHYGRESAYEGDFPLSHPIGQVGTEIFRILTRHICRYHPEEEE